MEILQKKVIRIINHAPYNSHTNNLFFTNKILKLNEINLFFQSVHVYKSYDDFPSFSHSYSTRNHSNLNPAFQRTVSTQRSLRYSAPTIWNQLPPDIKNAPTLSIFKNKLKSHLINKYANPSWSSFKNAPNVLFILLYVFSLCIVYFVKIGISGYIYFTMFLEFFW